MVRIVWSEKRQKQHFAAEATDRFEGGCSSLLKDADSATHDLSPSQQSSTQPKSTPPQKYTIEFASEKSYRLVHIRGVCFLHSTDYFLGGRVDSAECLAGLRVDKLVVDEEARL